MLMVRTSGSTGCGRAPIENLKKTAVVKATWRKRSIRVGMTANAMAAYNWLVVNNATYARFANLHTAKLEAGAGTSLWHIIPTATLLLQLPGVEVAARPWLYPRASFGESDLRMRLYELGRISSKQLPSLKASFLRKITSRCKSYEEDFPLFCLLHDIALAKQISGAVSEAGRKKGCARGNRVGNAAVRSILAAGAGEARRHLSPNGEAAECLVYRCTN